MDKWGTESHINCEPWPAEIERSPFRVSEVEGPKIGPLREEGRGGEECQETACAAEAQNRQSGQTEFKAARTTCWGAVERTPFSAETYAGKLPAEILVFAKMAMCSPQSPREPIGRRGGDVLSSPSASDQEDEYVVDRIIAQSVPDDSDDEEEMYLVRWEGYPDEQCTVSIGDSAHIISKELYWLTTGLTFN